MPSLKSFNSFLAGVVDASISFARSIPKKQYLEVIATLLGLALVMAIATQITPYQNTERLLFYEETSTEASYLRARIDSIENDRITVELLDGPLKNQIRSIDSPSSHYTEKFSPDDLVLVSKASDENVFGLVDKYRIPGLIGLVAIFMALVLIIGRRRGMSSLIGLAVSVIVIAWFVVPLILSGQNALWVSVAGAYMIAFSSIIIAHGMNTRTLISLGCIIAILTLVAIVAYLVVHLLGFSGLGDEMSFFLSDSRPNLDLRGVLIGGIIIASLGVLDDIITAQVATVDELFKANPKLTIGQLYRRASSVGGEHIASLVNTLALVYVGAALPTIILYTSYGNSNPMLLINGEFFATEVIRTIIASIGLVLAVPFSTIVGAVVFHKIQKR